MLIGDVGQNKVEEVDFQKANDIGGRNYGWNIVEGDSCYTGSSCNKSGITMPVYEYFHNGGGGAIIGGYVFRSAQSKSLWGQYLFTDEILKFVDAFTLINGTISGSINHLITAAQAKGNPVSFGEDKYGDQYILFYGNNTVYKLEDTSYLRRPKAYFTAVDAGGNSFLLQGWQGRNLTYQWLKGNVPIQGATFPGYTASTPGSYTFEVTNTLGFKDTSDPFVFGSSVSLLSFTARKLNGGLIRLDWETGAELNITGFTVQRRRDNEPEFSNIGFLTSKSINGFSNNVLAYTLSDSSVSAYKKLFYRLQIAYSNGSTGYSDIRFISADNTRNGFLVFPNPARRQANLFLDEFTQPVVLIVYDNSGRTIAAQKLNQQNNIVSLPAAKGVYILQVSSEHGENKVRKKLVVE